MEGKDRYYVPIENMILDRNIFPPNFDLTVLHQNPYIVKVSHFLTDSEIDKLLEMAHARGFSASTTVSNDKLVTSTFRTSLTSYITDPGHYNSYSSEIQNILKKVCSLVECDIRQIEQLMVVKYEESQYYLDHHDYFSPIHVNSMGPAGQRYATFFCYLNTLEEDAGGETEFPRIGVKARPNKGDATFWWNELPSGTLMDDTLHRGNPVKKGIKYGLNIWVRRNGW